MFTLRELSYEERWQKYYTEAKKFFETHGHLMIPYKYEQNNLRLGYWIQYQRQRKKGNASRKLDTMEIKLLEEIDMIWEVRKVRKAIRTSWSGYVELLKQYKSEYGDIDIPQKYEIGGVQLGALVDRYRQKRKNGELTKAQVAILDNLGMVWEKSISWDEYYGYAEKYYKLYGNLNVPGSFEIDGVKLGLWIKQQRYNFKKCVLSEEQIKKLNELIMIWEKKVQRKPVKISWQEYIELIKRYKRENGHVKIPKRYIMDGIQIGAWVYRIRKKFKDGKLTDNQVETLKDLGILKAS